jgi:hypothetical protein
MNIELRFLEKAIEDKNYISFSYTNKNVKKIKPIKLTLKNDLYFIHDSSQVFEYEKITKLKILKERF